jgi:hypothetical protein
MYLSTGYVNSVNYYRKRKILSKLAGICKHGLLASCPYHVSGSAPVSIATRHSLLSEKLPCVDGEACYFETITAVHAH